MPIQIERDSDDLVVIRAEGKLVKEDYPRFTDKFEEIARQNETLRVLFDMRDFAGWDSEGLWQEVKFDFRHDRDIRRLAVVGEEKWHRVLVNVLKPFAAAEIRYFHSGETSQAKHWLLAASN